MRKHTPFTVRVQPLEDLIDFPVSDSFRDHYAAQGLTYSSGRRSNQKTEPHPHRLFAEQTQALDTLRQERDGWKSRAKSLEARLVQVEEELTRLQERSASKATDRYRGVEVDVYA